MLNIEDFNELKFFADKVAKVHWPDHSEYIEINNLVQKIDLNNIDNNIINEITKLTNNYIIPEWACNAQTRLLNLLSELSK